MKEVSVVCCPRRRRFALRPRFALRLRTGFEGPISRHSPPPCCLFRRSLPHRDCLNLKQTLPMKISIRLGKETGQMWWMIGGRVCPPSSYVGHVDALDRSAVALHVVHQTRHCSLLRTRYFFLYRHCWPTHCLVQQTSVG